MKKGTLMVWLLLIGLMFSTGAMSVHAQDPVESVGQAQKHLQKVFEAMQQFGNKDKGITTTSLRGILVVPGMVVKVPADEMPLSTATEMRMTFASLGWPIIASLAHMDIVFVPPEDPGDIDFIVLAYYDVFGTAPEIIIMNAEL